MTTLTGVPAPGSVARTAGYVHAATCGAELRDVTSSPGVAI